MTKAELIATLAERRKITKAFANELVGDIIDIAVEEIARNEEFSFPGLVRLTLVTAAAREGRNPQTGEKIQIPEKRKIKAKALHPVNTLNFTL